MSSTADRTKTVQGGHTQRCCEVAIASSASMFACYVHADLCTNLLRPAEKKSAIKVLLPRRPFEASIHLKSSTCVNRHQSSKTLLYMGKLTHAGKPDIDDCLGIIGNNVYRGAASNCSHINVQPLLWSSDFIDPTNLNG